MSPGFRYALAPDKIGVSVTNEAELFFALNEKAAGQEITIAETFSLPDGFVLTNYLNKIKFARNKMLTTTGKVKFDCDLEAERRQIFNCIQSSPDSLKSIPDGLISLRDSRVEEIYPEWFGAKDSRKFANYDSYTALKLSIFTQWFPDGDVARNGRAKIIKLAAADYFSSKRLYVFSAAANSRSAFRAGLRLCRFGNLVPAE